MKQNDVGHFHACATCKHFRVNKESTKTTYKCGRLGYETKPAYQFHCWDPKDVVLQLMKKRGINYERT
ncbi:hypothetical protein ACWE42_13245 [Sutcliffiella cohnii]|uniref:Uncharacterized protein n=1 Tax=Sutcliffiella cohnii TaxID=33932 RepID=A0A223KQA9_9BACI|nr:hypothetical protein [Sutcliffiella cohnii]AST91649.1 hypothetical protein BC6307_10335 [Sutcliffiella cohnii]MED4014764.1 hypothetical protein [Sutcliffiella cohnii]